jgi:hypothetical protein
MDGSFRNGNKINDKILKLNSLKYSMHHFNELLNKSLSLKDLVNTKHLLRLEKCL